MRLALPFICAALRLSAYERAPSAVAGRNGTQPVVDLDVHLAPKDAIPVVTQLMGAGRVADGHGHVPVLAASWYINLDQFTQRRNAMEEVYRRSGLRYQRFPAVRPTSASLKANGTWSGLYNAYHDSRKPDLHDPHLVARIRGEIGCIASHLVLLRHIRKTGRPGEVYMIAEDDYVPAPDFTARLPTALALVPPDWDVIRLDCWELDHGAKLHRMPEVEAGVRKNSIPGCSAKDSEPTGRKDCYFCGGTHAVLVPYEKVGKLIALWTGEKGPLFPMDCMLNRPDFNNYCIQWGLFKPVPHIVEKGAIPKSAEKVTSWHLQ
jgi:GR25 family glycosyltransferase involved in LPS biosynthesis